MSARTPGGSLIYTTEFNRYEVVWGRDENGHIFAYELNINDPARAYFTYRYNNSLQRLSEVGAVQTIQRAFLRGGMRQADVDRIWIGALS